MKKLNVAIIGQGRSGRDIHGTYFLTDHAKALFNVVAVVDKMEERRKRAAETFKCDVYDSHEALYERNDIDLVVNASPSHFHYPITLDLLNHGINVVSEKPFSKFAVECENMINAAKKNNVMLSVFQNSHFAPYYVKLKEVLNSGVLGKIHQISIKFNGFSRRWDWQCSNRFYGGILLNTGPHPMEQAIDLLDTDEMPNVFSSLKLMHSSGDAEDYAKVILTYPDRPLIDVEINSGDDYSDHLYQISAERGSLKMWFDKIVYKYHEPCPIPELQLESLTQEDGISPAYCSETLDWKEVEEEIKGDAFCEGTRDYYQNIYNHLVNGDELVIRPEKILQQIRVMELAHAQNPLPTIY